MIVVQRFLVVAFALCLLACSGEKSRVSSEGTGGRSDCNGYCATDPSIADNAKRLLVSDVEKILAQAVSEANARGANATIAVVDRVGNVLAVYRMAQQDILIASQPSGTQRSAVSGGLEGIYLPNTNLPAVNIDDQAAISKAITAAYFSSEGNALTTRSAGQVIQSHFNPGERFQPAGPLFGVQFSQLACSDFNIQNMLVTEGPKRSPLGFAADPGAFPLYKNGTVVGAVGAIADGVYSVDTDIFDDEQSLDELIALAASYGYAAPLALRADRLTIDGKALLFSNAYFDDLYSEPNNAPAFGSATVPNTGLVSVQGYNAGAIIAGQVFSQVASGIRQASSSVGPFAGVEDAFIHVDASATDPDDGLLGQNRFPPIAGTNTGAVLTQAEVTVILREALKVANKTRRQLGRPLNGPARVSIAVTDTEGVNLGMLRSRDAVIFGADVALQKARTASFFSSAQAASFISGLPDAKYLTSNDASSGLPLLNAPIAPYMDNARTFFADPQIFANGAYAFTERASGIISLPFYPDGIDGSPAGPFSKPQGQWSIFNIGMQLDVSYNAILQHVLYTAQVPGVSDVGLGCAGIDLANDLSSVTPTVTTKTLANGLQTLAGSVPIYKGNVLVGGLGVSGDGIDQDDFVAFMGLHNAGLTLGTVNQAPKAMRADQLTPQGVRLRYVQCPISPYTNSSQQSACAGK